MPANIKRTKPKPDQQRLIDYSIFTGESLTHINKNYILQRNGRPPFTEQDLRVYHHGGKKNRERAIYSFHRGGSRSRSSYRPTLKLGYDPEEEDIELRHNCTEPRELRPFSIQHFKEQNMGKNSKDKHTKHKKAKLPSASLKALPKAVVDPEDSTMPIAPVTQNVEVKGVQSHFVYDVELNDEGYCSPGFPFFPLLVLNENSHKKLIKGQKHYLSSLFLSLNLASMEGFDSYLSRKPWTSDDGSTIFVELNTGWGKNDSVLAAILARLEGRDIKAPADNLRICKQEVKDTVQKHITIAFCLKGVAVDPNLLAECNVKGTHEIASEVVIGKRTVKSLFGKVKESAPAMYFEVGVQGSMKRVEDHKMFYDKNELAKAIEQLKIGVDSEDSDSSTGSSDDSTADIRLGPRRNRKPNKVKGRTSPIFSKLKGYVKKFSPRSKSTSTNSFDFSSKWDEERKKADKAHLTREYNRLVRKLQQEGKDIVQIDGDGNCAPTALAHDESRISSMELRIRVVRHMLAEPRDYYGFMEVNSLEEYQEKVVAFAESGVWFGEAQIRAAAHVLQRAVLVHSPHYPHEPQLHPCAGIEKGRPIELLYNGINHYDLVRHGRKDFSFSDEDMTYGTAQTQEEKGKAENEEEEDEELSFGYLPGQNRDGTTPNDGDEGIGIGQVSPLSFVTGHSADMADMSSPPASPPKRKRGNTSSYRRTTRSQTGEHYAFQSLGDTSSLSQYRKRVPKKIRKGW